MPNRTQSFISGLGFGYLAILVNIGYTAASIPLALHYLGKEQFGLWALAQQITGYLILLDFGVSSAVSRFIANHKDDVNGGDYGRLLLTGGIVFAVQGSLIAVVGVVFSIFAPSFFAIPAPLATDFTNILMIITFLAGFSIFFRTLAVPLWAFNRMDFSYLLGSITLLSGLVILWIGFHFGLGIYSLAVSGLPSALLSPLIAFYFCKKHGFYPSTKSGWQTPTFTDIRRVFAFGKDAALMSLGSQMVNASQIMIISRFAGLDVAATFSVGTKLYSLGQQLIAKIEGTSVPALTELFVAGNAAKFNARFSDIVSISIFTAALIGSSLVCGNSVFISIWTAGIVTWSPWADILLALLLLATAVTRCLNELFVCRGDLKTVRHIYLIEGLFFFVIAIPAGIKFGLLGLLASSLLAHLVVSLSFSLKAAAKTLLPTKSYFLQFLRATLFLLTSFAFCFLWRSLQLELMYTVHFVVLFLIFSTFFGWHFLLPTSVKSEVFSRIKFIG